MTTLLDAIYFNVNLNDVKGFKPLNPTEAYFLINSLTRIVKLSNDPRPLPYPINMPMKLFYHYMDQLNCRNHYILMAKYEHDRIHAYCEAYDAMVKFNRGENV